MYKCEKKKTNKTDIFRCFVAEAKWRIVESYARVEDKLIK